MVSWFNWTTFDLIGDLAFGESFGCLENVRMHPWVKAVFGSLATGVYFSSLQKYGLAPIFRFIAPKDRVRARLENYRYASEKIERRMKYGKDRGDFLDKVLKKEMDPEQGGMTIEELKSTAANLVLGGSETTATLLSGTVFQLCRNPKVMEKVVSEVRNTFSSEDEITITSTGRLSYLVAVLDEGMRIYPPVPSFGGRIVPHPGDTVDGVFLPGGTVVHIVQYAAYNLEANFKKPTEFLPERWLGDPEFENDNRAVHEPFSIGFRNCIGRNLAYAELRLIMTKLLYKFDLKLSKRSDNGNWIADQKIYTLWEKNPLWVELKPRA